MSQSLTKTILEVVNIVEVINKHVNLIKKGKNYWGICPFHDDTNPSMSVSPEKNIFSCFTCKQSGNVISFISLIKKISYQMAAQELATEHNIPFTSETLAQQKPLYDEKDQLLINILNDASAYFQNELQTLPAQRYLNYLTKRGISLELIEKHKIGFCEGQNLVKYLKHKNYLTKDLVTVGLVQPNNQSFFKKRLIFTITNKYGDAVGFSGRVLSGSIQKYINSPTTHLFHKNQLLYNFHNAESSMNYQKELFITEGFFDVLALERIGVTNCVALMGTNFSLEHIKFISPSIKINLMLDADGAGILATVKSLEILLKQDFQVMVINNLTGLDPDEILQQKDKATLTTILKNKIDGFIFLNNFYLKRLDLSSGYQKENHVRKMINFIPRKNSLLADIYISELAKSLEFDKASILGLVKISFNQNTQFLGNFNSSNVTQQSEVNKQVAIKQQHGHYFLILVNSLYNDTHLSSLYLNKQLEIYSAKNKVLTDIALYKTAKTSINTLKWVEKYIKKSENVKVIVTDEEFFAIIYRLQYDNLNKLKAELEQKLSHIDLENDSNKKEIQKLTVNIRNIKTKIDELKERNNE